MSGRPHVLASLACALAFVAPACGDDAAAPPVVELYIDGERAADAPVITFPAAVAGRDQLAAQLELKNLGPGAMTLAGAPPVRIEKDDRLAFSTVASVPLVSRYAAGESVVLNVVFRPHAAGRSAARLVIDVAERAEPFVVDLVGEGIDPAAAAPVLGVTIDGAPLGDAGFDFGAVSSGGRETARLRLSNVGTGTLVLANERALALAESGTFTIGEPTVRELATGEGTEVDVTFQPAACAGYETSLTIRTTTPTGELTTKVRGRGGTNPQGYVDVVDAYEFGPDGDVALSDALGGTRRMAVGNLSFGGFRGQVGVYSWDGCALKDGRFVTPTTAGLEAQLFGSQVALDDRGALMLVTARDFDEAWLFELQSDNSAKHLAALATFEAADGHGKGAALAGDGSAAFIGLSLADSGFDAHGAVLAYVRPAGGWVDLPEARWKLWPSNPTGVQQLGGWVDASADGRVAIAGGIEVTTSARVATPAGPIVYLWEATGDAADPAWGTAPTVAEPDARSETVRLRTPVGTRGGHAAASVARDGGTVALAAVREDGGVDVHVWVRPGASWGTGTGATALEPTASVGVVGSEDTRTVIADQGARILVADKAGGARELLRPAGGWDASAAAGRNWGVPLYGAFALSPDGEAFGGVDVEGGAWLVWR